MDRQSHPSRNPGSSKTRTQRTNSHADDLPSSKTVAGHARQRVQGQIPQTKKRSPSQVQEKGTSAKRQAPKAAKSKSTKAKAHSASPLVYIFKQLLKIVIVLLFMAFLFAAGLMIGYGVIGGNSPSAIFSSETWRHFGMFFR